MRFHYHQYQLITNDDKLCFTPQNAAEMLVMPNFTNKQEYHLLFGDEKHILIPRADHQQFLRRAQALLESEGYTLDTNCHKHIIWSTDDDQWHMYRKMDGYWNIYSKEIPFHFVDKPLLNTRKAAVEWAQSQNCF